MASRAISQQHQRLRAEVATYKGLVQVENGVHLSLNSFRLFLNITAFFLPLCCTS